MSKQISSNKKKLFNFKFKEKDKTSSYEQQEETEMSKFLKEDEKAQMDLEESESKIITDDEESIDKTIEETSIKVKLSNDKNSKITSKSKHQQEFESDYDSDSEPDFYNEPEVNESNYYDISQYDTEPIVFRIPEIKDDNDSENLNLDQGTGTDSNEDEDVDSVVISNTSIDPYAPDDRNLTFNDKWAKQVSNLSRGSDDRTIIHRMKKNKTRRELLAGLKTQYTKFNRKITKRDENINGLDTLIAFLTVFFDKVSTILGSVIFYSKTALRYKKGDKTWKNGIGRVFTIFMMGLVFLVIFKFLL
jgi:hypothetical protein